MIGLYQNCQHVPDLAAWGVVVDVDLVPGGACVWSENLPSRAVGHPAASGPAVGAVAECKARRCFGGS